MFASVAQLAEHALRKGMVKGSIPFRGYDEGDPGVVGWGVSIFTFVWHMVWRPIPTCMMGDVHTWIVSLHMGMLCHQSSDVSSLLHMKHVCVATVCVCIRWVWQCLHLFHNNTECLCKTFIMDVYMHCEHDTLDTLSWFTELQTQLDALEILQTIW